MADDDKVFLITGAELRHRRRDRPPRRRRPATGSCSPRAREDKLQALADELGGDERALAVRCDVTDFDEQEALVAATLERFGRLDVAFANAGFGAARGFLEDSPEHWREMVLTNVLRRRLHHPRHAARPEGVDRPPPAHRLGGRPARDPGQPLLLDQVGGHRHGRVAAPGARRHRRPRHA